MEKQVVIQVDIKNYKISIQSLAHYTMIYHLLYIDPLTFEWTDGLIASATRKFAKDSSSQAEEHSRPGSEASKVMICTNLSKRLTAVFSNMNLNDHFLWCR